MRKYNKFFIINVRIAQSLNGYCICVFWSSKGQDLLRNVASTFLWFNNMGHKLGWNFVVHLFEHKYCHQMSMWQIHIIMMMWILWWRVGIYFLVKDQMFWHVVGICQGIFHLTLMEYIQNILSYSCSHTHKITILIRCKRGISSYNYSIRLKDIQ